MREDAHHRRPHQRLCKAVDTPQHHQRPTDRQKTHKGIDGARQQKSGENDILGLIFIPKVAADQLAGAVGDGADR